MFNKKCFLCKRPLKKLYLRDGKKYYCHSCTKTMFRFGTMLSDILTNIQADVIINERRDNKQ